MTTWFTSDSHFGHARIIELCRRPFWDVSAMDTELVARWNAVVQDGDDVWCLGDFCYRNARPARDYLRRLRGRVHLVWGNHDSRDTRECPLFASSQAYAEPKVDGVRLVLLHYGMRTWPGERRGTLHLYGHSHGRLPGDRACVDVGVDYPAWSYRPVSLAEVRRHLLTLPERGAADRLGEVLG